MKNLLCLLLLPLFILTSCDKEERTLEMELAEIDQFFTDNGMIPIETGTGLHYVVLQEGSGTTNPSLNNQVNVGYKGQLLNGTIFEQTDNATFELGGLILGWQEGIQLMNKGDKYLLVFPSTLGYGSRGSGNSIPGHTPLAFEITLNDF